MSTLISFFNKTSNKTKGIFLMLLIMTIISCPNADSGSSSGGGSDDSGPLVVSEVKLIAGAAAKFNRLRGMAVDTDGTIYVADAFNDNIRKIAPDGTVSTYTSFNFSFPTDVLIIDANTLYVLDNNGIQKIAKDTATVSPFVTNTNLGTGGAQNNSAGLKSIVRNPKTNLLYIIDSEDYSAAQAYDNRIIEQTGNNTFQIIMDIIKEISQGQAVTTTDIGHLNTTHGFSDAVFDSTGNMYVSTGFGGDSIFTFNPTTAVRHSTGTYANYIKEATFFVGSSTNDKGYVDGVGTEARFNSTQGMIIKGDYIYVADGNNNVIRIVQISTKTVTTLVGIAGTEGTTNGGKDVATFTRPQDLEFAPNGDIIVSEYQAVRRIVVEK